MRKEETGWGDGGVYELKDLDASLSQPVLVARRKGYLWFPTLIRLENGELLAVMSNLPDVCTDKPTSLIAWSLDGGLTWGESREGLYCCECPLRLPNGDRLLLPSYMFPKTNGMGAACQKVAKGKRDIRVLKDEVIVTGWPRLTRSLDPKFGLAGFGFNGQTVELKEGGYLATLYGYFKDTQRYSLVAAESVDGRHWKIRSVIADENCKLQGGEGPCEAAMCRLKDGRLMCIFRIGQGPTYGQCWSRDEGKTWTAPVAMAEARSVQPSLTVMKDGTVVLSGGRDGLFLWINPDGTGNDWQSIDLRAHHNTFRPKEPFILSLGTTSYTEVVALDDTHLLLIYDQCPFNWVNNPKDSPPEDFSVWVVRIEVTRKK